MKVIVNLSNLVIESDNLKHLEALLDGCIGRQDYDYNNGDYLYYIKPMEATGINTTLLPDDVCVVQQLAWKMKQEGEIK